MSAMRLCPLGSGSSGNSLFLSAANTCLLIDAGLPAQVIAQGLVTLNVAVSDIQGILITHEHADHVRGAAILAKKYGLPIYANHGTADRLALMLPEGLTIRTLASEGTQFGPLRVRHFPVPHDAVEPAGFLFEHNGARVAIATDLGYVTREVKKALSGCQVIILEANHDEAMLANGPYPEYLKERIRSRHGHLSNRQSARALEEACHDDLRHVVLAHLSRENNDPFLARDTVAAAFSGNGPLVHLTGHYEIGPFLEVS
ncbi:MAG: MBL fold metallo-hydrolase [bacterium]